MSWRANKYGARKVTTTLGKFDSAKEARRYEHLLYMQRAGEISDLRRQVKFELVPGVKYTGAARAKPPIRYFADFVYLDAAGQMIVEDAKGVKTEGYNHKKHMMLAFHGIEIKEV